MGRVIKQKPDRAVKTLGRDFGFLLSLQKLSRVFERFGPTF